jgi:adenosine deaminase
VVHLRPQRIGHGLATARDERVRNLVIERGVTLEMCPTSNWLTGGVPTVAAHPMLRLLHEGVSVTLNTDDPGLMGIDLDHEWEVARDQLGFVDEDFRRVTVHAIAASFLPAEVKDEVRARRFGWLDTAPTHGTR